MNPDRLIVVSKLFAWVSPTRIFSSRQCPGSISATLRSVVALLITPLLHLTWGIEVRTSFFAVGWGPSTISIQDVGVDLCMNSIAYYIHYILDYTITKKPVLTKWRPNLEGEIRREDRPEKKKHRDDTPRRNFNPKRNPVSAFELPCVKPKNVSNLNMVPFCHSMKEIKHIQYVYKHFNILKQPTIARSSHLSMEKNPCCFEGADVPSQAPSRRWSCRVLDHWDWWTENAP